MSTYAVSARPGSRRLRGLAVAATVGAALVVWIVARPLAGVDLAVRQGSGKAVQHVGLASVVIVSLLAGLVGWVFLALLERYTSRARTVWTAVALVVLLLSLAGPLGAGQNGGAKIALACMHLAAGAALIPLLARSVDPS